MKIRLIIPVVSFVFISWFFGAQHLHAQSTRQQKDSLKAAHISSLIDQRDFVFRADMVYPLGGRSKNLSSDNYDLQISGDTVTADLPYYGRAYSAPIDPGKGGIQFTATGVDYSAVPRKKGGWDIIIKPKNGNDVQQLSLNVSATGYATLQVSSVNRQSISFSGTIGARKKRR